MTRAGIALRRVFRSALLSAAVGTTMGCSSELDRGDAFRTGGIVVPPVRELTELAMDIVAQTNIAPGRLMLECFLYRETFDGTGSASECDILVGLAETPRDDGTANEHGGLTVSVQVNVQSATYMVSVSRTESGQTRYGRKTGRSVGEGAMHGIADSGRLSKLRYSFNREELLRIALAAVGDRLPSLQADHLTIKRIAYYESLSSGTQEWHRGFEVSWWVRASIERSRDGAGGVVTTGELLSVTIDPDGKVGETGVRLSRAVD